MPEDDITLGELSRNVDRLRADLNIFRADMDARFVNVDNTIRSASFVSKDQYIPEQREQNNRLDRIEDGSRWLSRLIIGTAVGVIINTGLVMFIAWGGR